MRRRDELLGAARRVIGRDGFAGATVGTITREAGASLGLLNYHFGSRDEVVAEAFAGKSRVERHRLVNDVVRDELKDGVHALAVNALAPGEPIEA